MRFIKFLVKRFFPKKFLKIIKDNYNETIGRKNEKLFSGDAVYCPCCRKRFRGFMDFSVTKINHKERYLSTYKNTICPYCASMPRHRIICYYLGENKQIISKNNILMFGAEFSIRKWFDMNGFQYRTADLFDRSSDSKIDIQKIPLPDESWNLIICNHILEHVPDYKVALRELNRVLSKTGILEITIPTDRNFETIYEDPTIVKDDDRRKHFGQNDHLRIFGNDFENILNECGFLVEVIDGNTMPDEICGVIGPADYDDNRVYICRKR